jgi:hypothetical protein
MPRIRTIKPTFFKNEELAEVPMSARLLFIGLWCLADKEGRLEDRPKRIKAELFPYDSIEVDSQLSRLQSAGFIVRYGVGEMKVIQITNFTKHQRITGTEATSESELPEYQGSYEKGNTEETLRKQNGNTLDDWKGKEGKGKEGKGDARGAPPDEKKIVNPFSEKFLETWNQWKEYKKKEFRFFFKSVESEQASLNELVNLSAGNESAAREIILQSMAKGWKGLFKLKNEDNGHSKRSKVTGADLNAALTEFRSKRAPAANSG